MVLEMKRALEDLQKGDRQGYRKLYDAVYEDTYSRSFLILQSEEAAGEFMKGFFAELFGMLDEADPAKNQEKCSGTNITAGCAGSITSCWRQIRRRNRPVPEKRAHCPIYREDFRFCTGSCW